MLQLLFAAILVYTPNQIHFPSDLGLKGMNVANVLLLLALAAMYTRPKGEAMKTRLKLPILVFLGTLAIALGMAILRSPMNTGDDITYLKTAIFYPLFYFVFLHANTDTKTIRRLLIVLLAISAIAGLEAVREAIDYGIGDYQDNHRAAGPFGVDFRSANRAGVFYATFLPMFVAIAMFYRGHKWWRIAALGGIALTAAAVLFTYSRQSYFISILGVALLAVRRSGVMAVVFGIAFLISIPYLPKSVTQRVQETHQTGQAGEDEYDESTASRWEIWTGAGAMWASNPLGVGLNRFKTEIGNYSKYQNKDAHNFYVLTLAETGIQGLLALLFLIFGMLRLGAWCRRMAFDAEGRALALGFSVATLCMALGNIYGSPFLEGAVMGNFWALCGLLERYFTLRQLELRAAVPTATNTEPERRRVMIRVPS